MNNSFDNIQTEDLEEFQDYLDEREMEFIEDLEEIEEETLDLEEVPW